MHIVIFPCGKPNAKRWAAIGQDADRLFEVFGWQTGHVEATTGPVSWMFINGYGLDVLRQSGYSVQIRDFGEFDILSTAFEEDSVASLQQFIDYLRMMGELADEQVKFLRKIRPVIYPHPGYFELTQARLDFGRNTVVAKFDSGEEVTLAEGKLSVSQGKWLQWHQGCTSMPFRHTLCARALECFTSLFRPRTTKAKPSS